MKLLDGATALTTGELFAVPAHNTPMSFVVEGITTATVELVGRVEKDGPDISFGEWTADTSPPDVVNPLPYMRADVTAYTAGTINVWLV